MIPGTATTTSTTDPRAEKLISCPGCNSAPDPILVARRWTLLRRGVLRGSKGV